MRYLNQIQTLWNHIWFQNKNTIPLEILRIGIGSLMFVSYACYSISDIQLLYGDQGYINKASLSSYIDDPLVFSLLYYTDADWQVYSLYVVLLASCLLFTLGWRTSWLKWLVFFSHISFTHRNPLAFYGVDNILAALLFVMCLAPVGLNMSLDRVRKVRKLKKQNLDAVITPASSRWGFACTRLLQIQMASLYFYSAIEKLRGDSWWAGNAFWTAMNNSHTAFIPVDLFAHHFWLVNLLTYGTLLVELSYAFLIWGRKSRPYILSIVLLLHLGIAITLGLHLFALVMCVGNMVFLRREWLHRLTAIWKSHVGQLEIVYDGNCAACKRRVAWLLAFDGLSQIRARDCHNKAAPATDGNQPQPIQPEAKPADTYPGFEAYRFIIPRVPGLWWLAPLFFIPVLSRKLICPFNHRMGQSNNPTK